MCTTIYVLSKNKKNIKIFQLKIFNFLKLKKSQYIAWASFRNATMIQKSEWESQNSFGI